MLVINDPNTVIDGAVKLLEEALDFKYKYAKHGGDFFSYARSPTRICTGLMILSGRPLIELFDSKVEYSRVDKKDVIITLNDRQLPLLCSATLFLSGVNLLRETNPVAIGNDLHKAYGTGIKRCLKSKFHIDGGVPRIIRHIYAAICYRKYDLGSNKHALSNRPRSSKHNGISERAFLEYVFNNKRLTAVPLISFTIPVMVTPMKMVFE